MNTIQIAPHTSLDLSESDGFGSDEFLNWLIFQQNEPVKSMMNTLYEEVELQAWSPPDAASQVMSSRLLQTDGCDN